MRFANVVVLTDDGTHPIASEAVVTCGLPATLRLEPEFLFRSDSVIARWFNADGNDLYNSTEWVDRDTVAVFFPIPGHLPHSELSLLLTCGSERFSCTFHLGGRLGSDFFAIQAASQQRHRFNALRDWVIGSPFEMMLSEAGQSLVRNGGKLIAITGSVGKTSTKELISYLLAGHPQLKSTDSWNYPHEVSSQIILNSNWCKLFVLEMALTQHLPTVAQYLKPNILCFTELGQVHTSFGDVGEHIGLTKASLVKFMSADNVVVLNAGNPLIEVCLDRVLGENTTRPKFVRFGPESSVIADVIYIISDASGDVTIFDKVTGLRFHLGPRSLLKAHPSNISAAYCVLRELGGNLATFQQLAMSFPGTPLRAEVFQIGDKILLHDAYSANPLSMKNCLDLASHWRGISNKVVIIFGEMLDLGSATDLRHQEVASIARETADTLILVGPSYSSHDGAIYGRPEFFFHTVDDLLRSDILSQIVSEADFIAVKGSLYTGMMRVAEALKGLLSHNRD